MSVYVVANITIHDREGYSAYEAGFMDIFARYEGLMLAVDENQEVLEGEWDATRTVIIRFPSSDHVHAWYDSDGYQQLMQHRTASSDGNIAIMQALG
ncbi:MAG: DUF1330 domain-containing protein [Pseudomonadota bacterium]